MPVALNHLGSVKIIMDMAEEIANKDVLIVEDIIDSGITLNKVKEILETRNPKSIRILTLLDKPYRRKVDFKCRYVWSFHAPDEFLVGFGLDYQEEMRNLLLMFCEFLTRRVFKIIIRKQQKLQLLFFSFELVL